MELDLPIIRLTRTSDQNVRLARDPLDASMTLYSFLRAVPTRAEQQYAMDVFRRYVTGYYRDAHSELVSRGRHERTVQQLESAVFDGLLRYPPAVSPSWCRTHRNECLGPLLAADGESTTMLSPLSSPSHTPHATTPPSRTQSTRHSDEKGTHGWVEPTQSVAAKDLHMFVDPYTQYERTRQAQRSPAVSVHMTNGNTPVKSSSSTASVEDEANDDSPSATMLRRSTTRKPEDDAVARSTPTSHSDASLSSLGETSRFIMTATAGDEEARVPVMSTAAPQGDGAAVETEVHPVLALLLRKMRTLNARTTTTGSSLNQADEEDSRFLTAMSTKLHQTGQHLTEAHERLSEAAQRNGETRSIWDRSHLHHKAAESYLAELQKRLSATQRLFQVQRREQETVQAAHLAVATEVAALDLLLRDVRRCVHSASARFDELATHPATELDPQTRRDAEVDMALLVDLQEIMASTTPPSAMDAQ